MSTPQTQPTRSTDYQEAVNALKEANALSLIPGVFKRAAVRIGQYGWWGGDRSHRQGCATCIWLAVDMEMDSSFGNPNTPLRGQAFAVVMGYMAAHFGVRLMRDVFALNDKQPEHEGQSWAMYHLNKLADEFQAEYNL